MSTHFPDAWTLPGTPEGSLFTKGEPSPKKPSSPGVICMSKPSFLLTTCGSHVEQDMTADFSLVHIISGVSCAASCIFVQQLFDHMMHLRHSAL